MKRVVHLIMGMLLGALLASFAFAFSSGVMSQQDAVKLSPQYYKVLLDNDQVRVIEYRLKPGEKEITHSHPAGVLYGFGDAKLKVTYPDGRTEEIAATGGEAHWRGPVTHALENTGNTEAHALVVEPKNPCKQ
jgi:quercetin dioxygenase-like cupin family protein